MGIDPDEQVQATVRLIFDQFDRQGTLHGLLRYLVHHRIRIPVRCIDAGNATELEWRRPNRTTLQNLLHHPSYAGAYRFGHRPIDPRRKVPGRPATGKLIRGREECLVLIRDRLPAYIAWDRFEANQERWPRTGPGPMSRRAPTGALAAGRAAAVRAVRPADDRALLRRERYPSLQLYAGRADYGEPLCQTLPGRLLDELVAEQILAAVSRRRWRRAWRRWPTSSSNGGSSPDTGGTPGAGPLRGRASGPAIPGVRAGEPAGRPRAGATLGGGPEE